MKKVSAKALGAQRTDAINEQRRQIAALGAAMGDGSVPIIAPLRLAQPARPYRVICISIYEDTLTDLDKLIDALKARGFRTASRSALFRAGIVGLDVERAIAALRTLPEMGGSGQ